MYILERGNKVKIFGKMLLSFGIVILLFLTLNIFNISQSSKLESNGDYLNTNGVKPSIELMAIAGLTENTRVQMLSALTYKNIDATTTALTNLDDIQTKVANFNKTILTSDLSKATATFNEKWLLFDERVRKNVELMRLEKWEAASYGLKKGGILYNDAMAAFEELEIAQVKETNTIVTNNEKVYSRILYVSIGLIIITSIIAIGIAFVFSRHMVLRLKLVANRAKAIAGGDLSMTHIDVKGKDEIKDLAENLNVMQDELIQIVSKAHDSSQKVSASAEQLFATTKQNMAAAESIAVISQSNVESANIQLVNLTKIKSYLTNMDKNLQSIAQNGVEMDLLSQTTFEKMHYGVRVMHDINKQIEFIAASSKETEKAVEKLKDKSHEVGNMIRVITQIADQTSTLALSAEPHANEIGNGNTVVDEIKKLVQQSRNSAEHVSTMADDIQKDIQGVLQSIRTESECVNTGLVKSQEVKAVFGDIESMVGAVNENAELLNASIKSIAGISHRILENTQEVHKIANVTLKDAISSNRVLEMLLGSIDEITEASVSLANLAEQLQAVIYHFKIAK